MVGRLGPDVVRPARRWPDARGRSIVTIPVGASWLRTDDGIGLAFSVDTGRNGQSRHIVHVAMAEEGLRFRLVPGTGMPVADRFEVRNLTAFNWHEETHLWITSTNPGADNRLSILHRASQNGRTWRSRASPPAYMANADVVELSDTLKAGASDEIPDTLISYSVGQAGLAVSVSTDGRTWRRHHEDENLTGSCPCVARLPDGTLPYGL